MKLSVRGRTAYAYTGGKPFDATLPCIVFIHGAINDHSVWTLLARWFAHHGHAVLAIDQPGHVRSAGPLMQDIQSLADWTLALLDAAGVARAAVVGHSMGSLIALEIAARAPLRITHLAMIGTAFPMKVSESLLSTARDDPLLAMDLVNAYSHSGIAPKPSFPGPGACLQGSTRALMRRVQALWPESNLFHHDFDVCDRYSNGLVAAQAVRCPVSMILGQHDQMTAPRHASEIAAALRAKVITLPAGHSLMTEVPDAVLNSLRASLG